MAKVRLNGIQMHYQTKGEGKDVVLVHGLTSSLAVWYTRAMPALSRDFRVTAYDLRGHGYSELTPSGYTSRELADDLLALLDHAGIEKARFVGHSFGGSIALHLALLHPERVEAVVLGDTGVAALRYLRSIQDWPGWETMKDKIAQYGITYEWFVEAESQDVRDVLRKTFEMKQLYGAKKGELVGTPRMKRLVEESSAAAEFRQVAGLTEDRLREITAPVLAIYGQTSPYSKMAARLVELMPNCRMDVLPDMGHFHLLENMDLFLDQIRGFLADPAGHVAAERPLALAVGAKATDGSAVTSFEDLMAGAGSAPRPAAAIAQVNAKGANAMSRILLVSPKFDSEFSRARTGSKMSAVEDAPQSLMSPLHLATIAALTPPEFEVDIWDEGVRGDITETTDLGKEYDLVGVTGYIAHIPRAIDLARLFQARGLPVVIGGPGVSGSPELCRGVFDVIFLGEAELTWPRFLNEWKLGVHRKEYRQVERPDLGCSPVPNWSSVKDDVARYRIAGVQTTRGCPYDCEFCDVIHLFGRQPRHKPVERVIEEIKALAAMGVRRVFMCDDDFIADKRYTKQLLRELIPVNNAFDPPITYSTQLTIDLAKDEEMMELMADCNFTQALVGIETPRTASLEESHKVQNLRINLVEACRKIQSYGIAVKSSLIVGFDSDDTKVFDEQIEFVEDAYIPITTINTMKAYPGTPLWVRLQRENRVVDVSDIYSESPKVVSNIIPKGMTRVDMLEGWLKLVSHVRSWPSFARRAKSFISGIKRKPNVTPPSPAVRQQRMERMMKAQALLADMPEAARTAVTDVIMHTMATAPYMMEHLSIIMMQQAMDASVLPFHAEIIKRQIDHTLSGNMKLAPDPSAGMVPKNFKSAVKEVLPGIWDELSRRIAYQPGVPEALVGVMKDFLIRWGATFEGFEDYHQVYLRELCDRHVERANAGGGGSYAGGASGSTISREEATSSRFISAMLVAVEQEMRGETRSKLNAEVIDLTYHGEPVEV